VIATPVSWSLRVLAAALDDRGRPADADAARRDADAQRGAQA
jgi:hypothetical protein